MTKFISTLLFLVGFIIYSDAAEKPSDLINLGLWKITLPYAKEGQEKPIEISPPELLGFSDPRCFFLNEEKNGVVFRAHCTSISTKKSSYPRSELRELSSGASKPVNAAWGTADGKQHVMTITQAITAVPPVKKHVVCAQIHDAKDDIMMVRLEDKKLFVERNGLEMVMLDDQYKLGTKFTVKIAAHNGHIRVWYNEVQKMDWELQTDGCYFKAGCYTQSNSAKGDAPESYGEVIIYSLAVEHN